MAPGLGRVARRLARWSGLVISVVLLALIIRKAQDLGAARQALAAADYRWVAFAALLYLATFLPRGLRWARLLAGVRRLPLLHLSEVLIIGFMANNVLPFRLGEFVRAYVLGRKERVSATAAFATIVMERVCDGLTLVLLLTAISLFYPFPVWVKRLGIVTAALVLGATAFMLLLAYRRDLAHALVGSVTRRLPHGLADKAARLLDAFDSGLHLLRSPLDALAVVVLSLLIWGMEFAVYTRVLAAFAGSIQGDLDHQVALHDVLLLLIVVNFGIMIPSGPAYIGTFQAAAIAVLAGIAGLSEPVAFSISWVLWATMVLPVILLGFLFLAMEQLNLGAMLGARAATGADEAQAARPGLDGNLQGPEGTPDSTAVGARTSRAPVVVEASALPAHGPTHPAPP